MGPVEMAFVSGWHANAQCQKIDDRQKNDTVERSTIDEEMTLRVTSRFNVAFRAESNERRNERQKIDDIKIFFCRRVDAHALARLSQL
jgi:hypothetical protein